MFAIISENKFVAFLLPNKDLRLGDKKYPSYFLDTATAEEKKALGIVDVVYGSKADDRYYWIVEQDPVYANGVVEVNYTATPKDLNGCKNLAISQVNQMVHAILLSTDFMDSRKAHDPEYVAPEVWIAWRSSVRAAAKQIKADINATKTVDELAAIVIAFPHDPDYVELVKQNIS